MKFDLIRYKNIKRQLNTYIGILSDCGLKKLSLVFGIPQKMFRWPYHGGREGGLSKLGQFLHLSTFIEGVNWLN